MQFTTEKQFTQMHHAPKANVKVKGDNNMRLKKRGSRSALAGAVTAIVMTGLVACTPAVEEEPEGCESFNKFTFGMISPSAGYWLPLYAQHYGLWAEECIDFDPVYITSSANMLTALTTGDLQGAATTTSIGFSAQDEGLSVVAVASGQQTNDATLVGRPEIASIEDLAGKRVGTSVLNSTSTLAMVAMIEDAGVDDYELLTGGGTSERMAAMRSGAYEATWLLSPTDITLLEEGYSDLGSLADANLPGYAYSTMFVDSTWAAENRELLVRFLTVWAKAAAAFQDPANRERFERVLVVEQSVTPAVAAATYDKFHTVGAMSADGSLAPNLVDGVFELMLTMGEIDVIPADTSRYVDYSFFQEALERLAGNS